MNINECDSDDSDSDYSWRSISPISSMSEEESASEEASGLDDSHEEDTTEIDEVDRALAPSQHQREDDHGILRKPEATSVTHFRLCGDNIDKTVRQRYMRSDFHGSSSMHYFHSYAVADRIDFSTLSEENPPTANLQSDALASLVIPTVEDETTLRENFKVLISRVLFENVDYFRMTFDGIITWHIKHCYYEEMSKKSDTVSLRLHLLYVDVLALLSRFLLVFCQRMKIKVRRWWKLFITYTNMCLQSAMKRSRKYLALVR